MTLKGPLFLTGSGSDFSIPGSGRQIFYQVRVAPPSWSDSRDYESDKKIQQTIFYQQQIDLTPHFLDNQNPIFSKNKNKKIIQLDRASPDDISSKKIYVQYEKVKKILKHVHKRI